MELLRALGALAEPPEPGHAAVAEALGLGPLPDAHEHADLFTFQLYPYASVYLGAEGMLGGEARDRIAGFWRALGQTPPPEPDHLTTLLSMQAGLGELAPSDEQEEDPRQLHARAAHLGEHLLSWLPPYLLRVEEVASPFYQGWAHLLAAVLAEEAQHLGGLAHLPSTLHLPSAPSFRNPRTTGGDTLLKDLLSPARSGLILTRDDLARAADELNLALRRAERRYTLEALVGQDPAAILAWLAEESRRQAHSMASPAEDSLAAHFPTGPLGDFWFSRALTTAELLDELAEEARQS
ncbi:MAG: molecular chaperone TorD family protein [Acidobacteriota bacterium]|nr:molecular chaperone TorD family protein [Acidobacteriota bacterium]